MIPVAVIAFREFLEAFLIAGIFLGLSRKLQLKKEREILLAVLCGVLISFIVAALTYALGDAVKNLLTKDRIELLENFLLIFSGFFLVYVVFSLHEKIGTKKHGIINNAKAKLENKVFDFSLFTTIVFLVIREGFEIAVFTAGTSLFSVFLQNILGFTAGFIGAAIMGLGAFIAYEKFPIHKALKITEYLVIVAGASMVQVGITELCEEIFNVNLGEILSFHLVFLPNEHSFLGNFMRSFIGVDREFSLIRLLIMVLYGAVIYVLFKRKKPHSTTHLKDRSR